MFVGDIIEYNTPSFEITEDYIFKKANTEQIELIKSRFPGPEEIAKFTYRYESYLNDKGAIVPLNKENWNYWIIEHGKDQSDWDFEVSLTLSSIDINVLFEKIGIGGILTTPQIFHNFLSERHMRFNRKIMADSDLIQIREIYNNLGCFRKKNETNSFKYISKAIDDFYNLRLIPHSTPFKIVGIFSILEALLTYNPVRGQNSLTHQLKTKLNLLNNRISAKIDYASHFKCSPHISFETLIEKLYNYRHNIAHGDFSDFNNKLQIILGRKEAYEFLYNLLKKVLLASLNEPELVNDLKQC